MNQPQLDSLVINPKYPATHSIIWMHGLGADGYDFVDVVQQLDLPQTLALRFIFPHAPMQPIRRANGMQMRAWFDLGFDLAEPQDEIGIRHSQQLIEQLIEQEVAVGVPARNIFLAGFSQGGAMALQCGLRHQQPLGGILSLSGFLPLASTLNQEKHIANLNTPIFMAHGTLDPIIDIKFVKNDYQYLTNLGFNVKLLIYKMEHTVCLEELQEISNWLQGILC